MRGDDTFYGLYLREKERTGDLSETSLKREDVERVLSNENISYRIFRSLLGKISDEALEEAAKEANQLTIRNFGRIIHLYAPLYLSDFCENGCLYCGFRNDNPVTRKKLTKYEFECEAEHIAGQGLKNILLLTGGSRKASPVGYIKECVKIARKKFSSVAIEVYALTRDEYKELIDEGVDGLVIYQEVYDEDIYRKMHPKGEKKDYRFRLEAPERALSAGMRTVNIGPLLGLNDWRSETFFTALHAKYLEKKFPWAEIGVSVPRIRPQVSFFETPIKVSDKELLQVIVMLRIFLPRVGITVSTRERASLRDVLIYAGVTKLSAGSSTLVGGYTLGKEGTGTGQFEISDTRNIEKIKDMLKIKGYQPVLKDWA